MARASATVNPEVSSSDNDDTDHKHAFWIPQRTTGDYCCSPMEDSTSPSEEPSYEEVSRLLSTLLLVEVTTPWRMMKPKSFFGPNVFNVLSHIDIARQSWKNQCDRDRLILKVNNLISAQNQLGNTALEVRFLLENTKNYFFSLNYEKTLEQCEFAERRAAYIENEHVKNHLLQWKTFMEIASYANLKKHGKSEEKIHQLGDLIRNASTDYNDFFRLSYNIGTYYVGQLAMIPQPTQEMRNLTAKHFQLCMDYQQQMVAQDHVSITLTKVQLYNPAVMAIKVYLDFPEKEFGRQRHLITEKDLIEADDILKQVKSATAVEELRSVWRLWARVQLTVAGYHFRSAQLLSKAFLEKHKPVIPEFDRLCKKARTQAVKILEHMEVNNAPTIENIGESIKKLKKTQFFQATDTFVSQLVGQSGPKLTVENRQAMVNNLKGTFSRDKNSLSAKVNEICDEISEHVQEIENDLVKQRLLPFEKNFHKMEESLQTTAIKLNFLQYCKDAVNSISALECNQLKLMEGIQTTLEINSHVSNVETEINNLCDFMTKFEGDLKTNDPTTELHHLFAKPCRKLNNELQSVRATTSKHFQNLLSLFEKYFASFARFHHCLCTAVQSRQSICVDIRYEIQTAAEILSNIVNDAEVGNVYEELKLAKEFHRYLTTTVSPDCTDELLLTTLWPLAVVTEI